MAQEERLPTTQAHLAVDISQNQRRIEGMLTISEQLYASNGKPVVFAVLMLARDLLAPIFSGSDVSH
jgi:hypothetical protein